MRVCTCVKHKDFFLSFFFWGVAIFWGGGGGEGGSCVQWACTDIHSIMIAVPCFGGLLSKQVKVPVSMLVGSYEELGICPVEHSADHLSLGYRLGL